MKYSTKQLIMLGLAIFLLFYKPTSPLMAAVGVIVGIVLLILSILTIREHRAQIKKDK